MTMPAQEIDPPRPEPRSLGHVLDTMPDGEKWEIVDGGLFMQAAAATEHNLMRDGLLESLRPAYHRGKGGPGGWWILAEQRFQGGDPDRFTLEPDLAGWRRERLPDLPSPYIPMAPDWVCEVLSPGTVRLDRGHKMRAYAALAVTWYWIADPLSRGIEVYQFRDGAYDLAATLEEGGALPPFTGTTLDPAILFA